MKYQKYYDLIKEQSEIYDKTQNCQIGQTWNYHLYPVIKNACAFKDTIKKVKRLHRKGETANHICEKGFMGEIYQELI